MTLLLNWRLWAALIVAAALAFSHLTIYRKGKQDVRNEWEAAVAVANEDARKLEQQRQRRADEAGKIAAGRNIALRRDAASARASVDGLRHDLDAVRDYAAKSSDAAAKSIAALTDVFQQCTRAYSGLAEEADRHASDSLNYQQAWPK